MVTRKRDSSWRKRARDAADGEDDKNDNSNIQSNQQKEQERRGKMSDMFHQLQSLVPSLKGLHKVTREKIVGDATSYIKSLEGERERLERLKESRKSSSTNMKMNTSCDVNVSKASNGVVFFGIQTPKNNNNRRNTMTMTNIFMVFQRHKAEVLSSSVSANENGILRLAATVLLLGSNGEGGDVIIEKIKREILLLVH